MARASYNVSLGALVAGMILYVTTLKIFTGLIVLMSFFLIETAMIIYYTIPLLRIYKKSSGEQKENLENNINKIASKIKQRKKGRA